MSASCLSEGNIKTTNFIDALHFLCALLNKILASGSTDLVSELHAFERAIEINSTQQNDPLILPETSLSGHTKPY